MQQDARGRRARRVIACAAAVLWAGCVPIPRTATLSPPVVGTLQRDDRVPLAGERLVLSVAHNDSTCTRPSQSATVDSAGRFAFAAVRQRESFTPVLFDRVLCYSICGGQSADPVYSTCFMHSAPAADTLACVAPAVRGADADGRIHCLHRPRRGR